MGIVILVLVIIFGLCIAVSMYNSHFGIGDARVQFKRSGSGSSVCTGRGGSLGAAMADGFEKLYHSLSPNSRLETIQSRYDVMVKNLSENRHRMFPDDIAACERYIQHTKSLLDQKREQVCTKAMEQEERDRLAREKRSVQLRQRREREKERERMRAEKQKNLPAQRQFVAEQRRLMTDSLRYDVMHRDGFRCQLCGATAADGYKLHVDHILPVSKGGKTEMSNLRTLCERCNMGKRDKIEQTHTAEMDMRIADSSPKSIPPTHSLLLTQSAAYKDALQLLHENGTDYIDKTDKGGALYFFQKDLATQLKESGHKVYYAPNGTGSTSYRPAWYVK